MRYERYEKRGNFSPRSFAPVKVGDELDVKIEAVGEKGDGIAKKDGFVLFVAGTKQGEDVRIKVTRVLQKVGFAEVVGQGAAQGESKSESEESDTYEKQEVEEDQGSSTETQEEYKEENTENFGETE